MSRIWDVGLQPERTHLAWRRTSISLVVVSLIAVRALPIILGSWLWVIPGIIGVIASAAIWWAATTRHRATVAALQGDSITELPSARLLLWTAILTTAIGSASLLLISP